MSDSGSSTDDTQSARSARIPPRWFIRTAWAVHRGIYRVSGGRWGLRKPRPDTYGMMRLHTVGRQTGKERTAIVAYLEDGDNLVTMAMNGWADPPPAWWLNLRARPEATVDLPEGRRAVRARQAESSEQDRLWAAFAHLNDDVDLDALASQRSRGTPLVILEPR